MSRWENDWRAGRFADIVQGWRGIALFTAVGLSCAFEMRNYVVMAVECPLYELLSDELMRGLKIPSVSRLAIRPHDRTIQDANPNSKILRSIS